MPEGLLTSDACCAAAQWREALNGAYVRGKKPATCSIRSSAMLSNGKRNLDAGGAPARLPKKKLS
jgi:hypothetical protein